MDLVNDVNLVLASAGGELNLVTKVTNVVDAVIGRGINLDHIKVASFGDRHTVGADLIWLAIRWVQAVERLRQNASG